MSPLCRTRWPAQLALVPLAAAAAPAAVAQTLPFSLSVTVEHHSAGNACLGGPVCGGETAGEDPGRYLFTVNLNTSELWFPVDAVRLAATWPAAWTVTDAWSCGGVIAEGDPTVDGDPLLIELTSCIHPAEVPSSKAMPILQLVIDCPVPGRFYFSDPGREYPNLRTCQSEGWGYPSSTWSGDFWFTDRVEIGDYCGRLVIRECGYCDRGLVLAGTFLTEEIDLSIHCGDTTTERVRIRDGWCTGPPAECNVIQYNDPCVNGLRSDAPWISVEPLSDDEDPEKAFDVTIASADLPIGVHETRLEVLDTGCIDCRPNCQELTLTVLPPVAVETMSWSRVKARY